MTSEAAISVSGTGHKIKKILLLLLKAFLIALCLVAAATYVLFSPPVFVSVLGPKVLLFPMPAGGEYDYTTVSNIKAQEVFFTNKDGQKLHGWYWKNPTAKKTVLFMHGNAGNIGHRLLLSKCIIDAGASLFIFDYRGYGKSEGTQGVPEIISDSDSAYECLEKQLKVAPEDIILYGESIGAAMACEVAKKHKAAGLVLDSTFTSLLRVAKKKVPYYFVYPDFLQSNPSLSNIDYLTGPHPPLLIMHGGKDEILPLSEAKENFAAASEPKKLVILENSFHNQKAADWELYIKTMKEFFASLS
jgi:uncharacterized protein